MDKLDRIIQESARQAARDIPLHAVWSALEQAARIKTQRRVRIMRHASMAAMLTIGLGLGVLLGRSPAFARLFAPEYIVVDVPKTDGELPEFPTVPDAIVVDPPKTDGEQNKTAFVLRRAFGDLPASGSVEDLQPGWLPENLRDQIFILNRPGGYWQAENADGDANASLAVMEARQLNAMLAEWNISGLPEGFEAGGMEVGEGILLQTQEASEEGQTWETWILRISERTYAECAGSASREDIVKIIENLGNMR